MDCLHVHKEWSGSGKRMGKDKIVRIVTIMGVQGQRHTRNQQKSSGNDIYGLISLDYLRKGSTGPNQWLDNYDRLGLTTGWAQSLIHTRNTRSCIMTSTGYYRLPYNQDRLLIKVPH